MKTETVYSFGSGNADGDASMKKLLGGKGANLAEMAQLGIPVPPGFTITTEICNWFNDHDQSYPKSLDSSVRKALAAIEAELELKFGDSTRPLLVSVRSGGNSGPTPGRRITGRVRVQVGRAEGPSGTPLALGILSSRLRSVVAHLWQDYAQRLLRYIGVTFVNVLVGQTLLYVFHAVLEWPGMAANALAVAVSSIPAYLLSRHYVWEQPRGGHSVGGEIAPFWILAFAGLALSTVTVGVVDGIFGGTLSVQLANASAFGALWIVGFFVRARLLGGDAVNGPDDAPSDAELTATAG